MHGSRLNHYERRDVAPIQREFADGAAPEHYAHAPLHRIHQGGLTGNLHRLGDRSDRQIEVNDCLPAEGDLNAAANLCLKPFQTGRNPVASQAQGGSHIPSRPVACRCAGDAGFLVQDDDLGSGHYRAGGVLDRPRNGS